MSVSFDELTITNDFLFKKVMQNKRICKHLIEEILQIRIETLTFVELEKSIDIYHGSHGIRLDITAHDERHTRYNIEMQASDIINKDTGLSVLPKRTRYYQAMLDMDLLKKGQPYDMLNPTYIIFICNFDLFGRGLYSYTFQKKCKEDPLLTLPDDTTILFLNATGTHGEATPHTKSFLTYVHEHIVTDAFTDEINTEILKIKCDEKIRGEFMHFELLLHDKKEEGRREKCLEDIKTLMESLNLSVENAMTALKIPSSQWDYYKKQILSSSSSQ